MQWPISEIRKMEDKFPFLKKRFGYGLFILTCLFAAVGVWHLWSEQDRFWIRLVAVLPVALLLVWSFIRLFFSRRWRKKELHNHQYWQSWTKRHITILDSRCVLPSEIEVDEIFRNPESQIGKYFTFSENEKNHADEIVQDFMDKFTYIATRYYYKKLALYLDYAWVKQNNPDFIGLLEQAVWEAQQSSSIDIDIKLVCEECPIDLLDDWVEQVPRALYAVFSPKLHTQADSEFTENISWLIFADSGWAVQDKLPVKAQIERPIDVDLSDSKAALSSVKLFKLFGLAGREPVSLWSALPLDKTNRLNSLLTKAEITLPYKDNPVHSVQNAIGNPPPNMAWLTLAVTVQDLDNEQPCLLAWEKSNSAASGLCVVCKTET